jgi:hypothetical protein
MAWVDKLKKLDSGGGIILSVPMVGPFLPV